MVNGLIKKNFEGNDIVFRKNETTGQPEVRIDEVAKFCGWINISKGKEYVNWTRVNEHLVPMGCADVHNGDFIPEYIMYPLIGKASNKRATQFMLWVGKVLTEIRMNGGYISPDASLQQRQDVIKKPYSMRGITKTINETEIMDLENVVKEIIDTNCSCGKRDRIDKQLKDLNSTEYKQHVRKHIRQAIENKDYSDDRSSHALEIAIRDKIVIELLDNVLETNNRSAAKEKQHLKKTILRRVI